MITDKDREELRELTRQIRSTKMDAVFFDYGWNECAEIIMRYVDKRCAESAEQARKETAENGIIFMQERLVPGVFTDIMLDEMRAAILAASDRLGVALDESDKV